jgi:tetratricopeptide (TPR) repeat protein
MNIYPVKLRIAKHYANRLQQADSFYQHGSTGIAHAITLLKQDWEQIRQGQKWASAQLAVHLAEPLTASGDTTSTADIAALCIAYTEHGATILEIRQDPAERLEWLQSSLTAARHTANRRSECTALLAMSRMYQALSLYPSAHEAAQTALRVAQDVRNWTASAAALYQLGIVEYRQSQFDTAQSLIEESLTLRTELGDQRGISDCYHVLGLLQEAHANYAMARQHYETSLRIRRELGDWRGIADSLAGIGRIVEAHGKYSTAQTYFEESLAIRRELGDQPGIASSLLNLGAIAQSLGEHETAQAFMENSLEIRHKIGNMSGVGRGFFNLAILAYNQGDYDYARTRFEESLSIFTKINNRAGIGLCNLWISKTYTAQNQFDEALQFAKHSLDIAHEGGNPLLHISTHDLLGLIDVRRGDITSALRHSAYAVSESRAIGNLSLLADTLCHAAFAHLANNDLTAAEQHLRESLSTDHHNESAIYKALIGMAHVFQRRGDSERAAVLAGVVKDHVGDAHYWFGLLPDPSYAVDQPLGEIVNALLSS